MLERGVFGHHPVDHGAIFRGDGVQAFQLTKGVDLTTVAIDDAGAEVILNGSLNEDTEVAACILQGERS